jgi:pimeloyl-ACP methyl ester carboxylesterase
MLKNHFEKKYGESMENYSSHTAAKEVKIPILIIHDKNDDDVPVKAAYNIQKHSPNSELLITEGWGHRKILGETKVIEKIKEFISSSIQT